MKIALSAVTRRLLLLAAALLLPLVQVWAEPPGEIPPGLQRAVEVQRSNEAGLLSRPGVVGIGIGQNPSGQPVIQILTEDGSFRGLPRSLGGVPVETQVTGRFRAQQALTPAQRWPRPVPIGVSVAHPDVTAGTLGVKVRKGKGTAATYYVLSNNHVLANANLALIGDPILQPGPYDGGTLPGDVIATLTAFQPINFAAGSTNTIDAAIAQVVNNSVGYSTPAGGYGAPSTSTLSPSLKMPVMKFGRTTSLTTGTITGVNYTVDVAYGNGQIARFTGQFIVTGASGAFSQGGDSGSLVVAYGGRNDRKPVGLLFAGADNLTVANPIKPILSRFGVSIAAQ
jgi:hypothetical protein